jgi:hypothetical protein
MNSSRYKEEHLLIFEFTNAPMMSCRQFHFPSGKVENVLEK